ncbi:MAG: hypothetical protein C0623_13175 [Desulfuromonas sp.]|nr:MAG: hypothetical protein C0623_13175 [Desulfuromonas sp.]
MKNTPNRRLTERFDLMVPVVITQVAREETFYSQLCMTKDISSQGAYIGLTNPVPDDDEVYVQLLYPLKKDGGVLEYVKMTATGTIVRREACGLAIIFDEESTLKPFYI